MTSELKKKVGGTLKKEAMKGGFTSGHRKVISNLSL